MRRVALIIRAACLCLGVLAAPVRADPGRTADEVQDLLKTFHQTYEFPGATVAIVQPDGKVLAAAVGLADVEGGRSMTNDSRMLAASIGKTFWGALSLALESDGVLNRSDLVSDYLGNLPWFSRLPNSDALTVGQLLTHSGGLPDHVHMESAAAALMSIAQEETFAPADVIALILDEPPLFEPGSGWAYSDTGYLLLGEVITTATDRDVFDLVKERFLLPLGLQDTAPSNTTLIQALAVGYTADGNPLGLPERTMGEGGRLVWNPAIEWTGGGFASTSSDLALWGHALFTGKAMEVPYLDRLLDGVPVHPEAPDIRYGCGVAIYTDTPHGPVFGHGGWIPGYVSSLRHYADHGVTIAFQINTDVGVIDDSTDLVPALEAALAGLVLPANRE